MQQQEQLLSPSPEVKNLLSRHKFSLLRELESTNLLNALLKRGVIQDSERQNIASSQASEFGGSNALDVERLIDLVQAKGFEAFREFCFALEAECPHVLTDLLVDQHALTEEQEKQREQQLHQQQQQPQQQQQNQQQQQPQQPQPQKEQEQYYSQEELDLRSKISSCSPPLPSTPPPPPPQPPPPGAGRSPEAAAQPILELLDEPVDEPVQAGGERGWEVHHVTVTRVPGYGFGIAVSGGRDNPHFTNGDPAIAISDVLKAGPAEGKLQVNDRIISANGVSLEGADYGAAVRVLRDSGATVLLVVRRRAAGPGAASPAGPALPAPPAPLPPGPQTHRLSLTRPSRKEDFGLVLGCRLYVREVTRDGTGARPGDLVTRIAGVPADNMSLKEARKLMEQSKDRLSLVVSREPDAGGPSSAGGPAELPAAKAALPSASEAAGHYSSQNLYVPPPTRQPSSPASTDQDKSNLAPRGRSRGPLIDCSLSQLDLPATPQQNQPAQQGQQSQQPPQEPPRPPPPRAEDYYGSRRQTYEDDPLVQRNKQPVPDPRFITFQKEGSVGVRLTGGNETGVFVTAVQPGSPASLQGLQPGDKILKVNDMDMKGVTREEAVLFLLSLQEQIDLIVQHRRQEYEQIIASGKGDSFHIKTHFHYEQPEKGEMSFRSGDVFHVVDTLHNGVVGSWQVYRIGRNNQEVQKGIVPNKARAEELATAQFNATKKELSASESRGSFFRRRRGSHRRSKSLGRDHWDDVVFSDSVSKFPAYERVVLRHPGFIRPVVLFGPVADLARDKLLKDFPDKFTSPQTENQMEDGSKNTKTSGIIRLSAIREVMDRGKHALLDITPNAVDRLNYAQFYPIVIFLKAESKQIIKEMRTGIPKSAHKSSKKLLEQCQKLDKIWGHVFSAVVTLTSPESWYRKLRELIDWQQQGPLWMSQTKPEEALSDDFLFPMTSRLSYASSPESDLELSPAPPLPGVLGVPSRLKSSSDPSIATQDDAVAPPPYTTSYQVSQLLQSLGEHQHFSNDAQRRRSQPNHAVPDTKYGFSQQQSQQLHQHHHQQQQQQQQLQQQQQQQQQQQLLPQQPPLPPPPDLPPRLDRNTKPSPGGRHASQARSAQERLINKADSVLEMGNYINATPHRANTTSSLERQQAKAGSYDSMSSYDSYNTNGVVTYPGSGLNNSTGRLGPNVPDDLKSSSIAISSRPHDPYRFTRSTAIPVQESQPRTDYAKYSRSDYKTTPPSQTKPSGTYKPVPPPKPKNYRPPQQPMIQDENNSSHLYQHAKSYSMGTSHIHNGTENGVNAQRSSAQYYYNISPPNRNVQNEAYSVSTNHGHSLSSQAIHSHSMSHSHPLSSPSIMTHSHSSNSSSQIGVPHSHNRSNVSMNGHSHSNSHSGITLQNSSSANSTHNRDSSALDLAGSREQRGSAFELYRKPLHHHNIRTMGMARGAYGSEGGVLEGPGGVTLIIPPGALPPNSHQEIYFSVTDANGIDLLNDPSGHRSSISPPMHNGESLLSPLVECGPKGLEFLNPVELRIPHRATSAHRVALKATDTEENSRADWLNVKLPDPTSDRIIVRLDHF